MDFVELFRAKLERTFESKNGLELDNSLRLFVHVLGNYLLFKVLKTGDCQCCSDFHINILNWANTCFNWNNWMQLHCLKACNGQESMLYFCVILLPGCLTLSHLHCACTAIYLIILGGFSVSCYSEGVLCHTVFCTSLQFTLQPLPLHPHLQSSIPLLQMHKLHILL